MGHCDVAIVGGGPVGLLLGCLLAQRGVHVQVIERSTVPRSHSRAIGIHPPGLACLARVGAAEAVLAAGIRVRRGIAFGRTGVLGQIGFESLPGPYPFVLCAPQSATERVLEARLGALAPDVLTRGAELVGLVAGQDGSELLVRRGEHEQALGARFVVGCDGKHSRVRAALDIGFAGGPYGRHFAMADLDDETRFGGDAAVFLTPEGLVESFPLPGHKRRWVVEVGAPADAPRAERVATLVRARTGQRATAESATMVSAFTAEHYLAERFVRGTALLAGDAAHVVSPIGGQGMNLGWLDAALLAQLLPEALAAPSRAAALLRRYERLRRRAAAGARRRAELFMAIGRGARFASLRERLVAGLLREPLAPHTARVFTMRGLESAAA